jgi:hypothetical protein
LQRIGADFVQAVGGFLFGQSLLTTGQIGQECFDRLSPETVRWIHRLGEIGDRQFSALK